MKRILTLGICMLVLLPLTVNATGGGLRKSSIKTCPNGVTYGMHSDGHGGTHWHVAVTNGNNYYADGEAIYSDPCPGYNKNEGTAGATDGSSNSSSNSSGNGGTSSNYGNNYSNNNTQNNSPKEVVIEKSKDNSIKEVSIDDEQITVSDNMNFKTEKKHVDIKIKANDSKAKVEFENKELSLGENTINIVVTAENGDKKNYTLTINKTKGKGTATIKKFVLGSSEVEFENNKATITKLKNETSLDYSYELSDAKAKLKIYLNEKEITKLESLKENDKKKLIVLDENDNENIYEIIITDYPAIVSTIIDMLAIIITAGIFLSPIVIILIIKNKKKNKQSNNVQPEQLIDDTVKKENQNNKNYETGYDSYTNKKINEFNSKYDLTTIDGIMSIPITEAQKYSDGGESVVYMPEQILSRKATEYKNNKSYDLAIACLKKVNELYPHSFYAYTRDDYERLVDMMILAGRFEDAKVEHKNLNKLHGTRVDELHNLQKFASETGTESAEDYQKRIIDPYIEEAHDREVYYWLLENIPQVAPKSFGGYRRIKNMNSTSFKQIVEEIEKRGYKIEEIRFWM